MPNIQSAARLSADYKQEYIESNEGYYLEYPEKMDLPYNEKIYVKRIDRYLYIKLVDVNELDNLNVLSFMALELVELEQESFYQIRLTRSFYPKTGKMTMLFNYILFELGEPIISDAVHTMPGSMNFWLKMAVRPELLIDCFDLNTGESFEYDENKMSDIWGLDDEFLINGLVDLNRINQIMDAAGELFINNSMYKFIVEHEKKIKNRQNIVLRLQATENVGEGAP